LGRGRRKKKIAHDVAITGIADKGQAVGRDNMLPSLSIRKLLS